MSWSSTFGAAGVLFPAVAYQSMPLHPSTRSLGFAVVTEQDQPVTPAWVVAAAPSSGLVGAIPVKDAAAIRPWVTAPEKVAVTTVFVGRPFGAGAEAIAARMVLFAAFAWVSIVQVSPPPATDVSVRVAWVQLTKTNTREPAAAALAVVRVMVLLVRLSVFVPRLWSSAIAPGTAPVPLTATVCGLPGALSAIDTLATRAPTAVGVKVTGVVQLAFAASVLGAIGQVGFGANAKSPAFVPPSVIELIVSGAVPVFFSVTDCSGLVVLTVWLPKVRLAGVSVTAGCVPLPLSAT